MKSYKFTKSASDSSSPPTKQDSRNQTTVGSADSEMGAARTSLEPARHRSAVTHCCSSLVSYIRNRMAINDLLNGLLNIMPLAIYI